MITDTEAIVLRQVRTVNSRRMLVLFSKKFGKISVGSNLNEGGKNKTALAQRPFTYGRYELFKSRENYNLNNGQVLKSYYSIGEDLDKYMAASYVLELTEKVISEDLPQPAMFHLLLDYLDALEKRKKKQETLTIAYMVKALAILGVMPHIDDCTACGAANAQRFFSIEEGGMVCENCAKTFMARSGEEPLIYDTNFGIVNILKYFQKEPFSAFEKIALQDEILKKMYVILKQYFGYHLDVKNLKCEELSFLDLKGISSFD